MNKILRCALPLPALLSGLAVSLPARSNAELEGYGQFGQSRIVRDGFSGCVRSGTWTPERVVSQCRGAAPASAAALARTVVVPPPPPEAVVPPPPPPVARAPEPSAEPAEVKPLPATPAAEAASVAPVAAPALEPAPVQSMSLSAEALFDLSKASVKPAARAQLDALSAAITAAPFENVRITGHTDRTGSAALNRKLSQQRAAAVKAYLVMKGVPASKVVAEGRGSSEPRTAPSDCEGLERAELATCLQPDRRVDIEVRR